MKIPFEKLLYNCVPVYFLLLEIYDNILYFKIYIIEISYKDYIISFLSN